MMGMRVGGSGAAWSSQSASSVSNWQTRQQGMKDLFANLKAGDLAGAQKAFAAIEKITKIDRQSVLGQLGEALQSGDLATAEKLAESMQAKSIKTDASQAPIRQAASPLDALRGKSAYIDLLA